MFPVPVHLPQSRSELSASEIKQEDSKALNLLQPLLQSKQTREGLDNDAIWTSNEVLQVKESLKLAIDENKATTHGLLIENLPMISHQIQLGTELRGNFEEIEHRLDGLENQLDASNLSASFLPPLIHLLNDHFGALSTLELSETYIKAYKALKKQSERVKKLEEAVWNGQGAEDWVINVTKDQSLGDENDSRGILEGTDVSKSLNDKETKLKATVKGQLTEGFNQIVIWGKDGLQDDTVTLQVKENVVLRQPTGPQPEIFSSHAPPSYALSAILTSLSSLSLLSELLENMAARISREIVIPLVSQHCQIDIICEQRTSTLISVRSNATPQDVLTGVKKLLDFIHNIVFPPTINLRERQTWLEKVTISTFQSLLSRLLIPSIPSSTAGLPQWLDLLQSSLAIESSFWVDPASSRNGVLQTFWHNQAGREWATKQQYDTADAVRTLVLVEWRNWVEKEEKREREVVSVVEIEVDDGELFELGTQARIPNHSIESLDGGFLSNDAQRGEDIEEGWGFNDTEVINRNDVDDTENKNPSTRAQEQGGLDEDDGWGFDDNDALSASGIESFNSLDTQSKTQSHLPVQQPTRDDELNSSLQLPASPSIPNKPPKEAKRLGRKVAKKDKTNEPDPWDPSLPHPYSEESPKFPIESPLMPTVNREASSNNSSTGGVSTLASSFASFKSESKVASVQSSSDSIPESVKPAKEAKRLGKKVAKKPKEREEDSWSVEMINSISWQNPNMDSLNLLTEPNRNHEIRSEKEGETGLGKGDNTQRVHGSGATFYASTSPHSASGSPKKRKRKELREEKRIVQEKFLVSKCCDELIGIAKKVAEEIRQIELSDYPSQAFNIEITGPILAQTIADIFALYRALLPIYYAQQLRDVPSLAMQAYNDAIYLSSAVHDVSVPNLRSVSLPFKIKNEEECLSALASHHFEQFLSNQIQSLEEDLSNLQILLEKLGDDVVWKKSEKVIGGIVHKLESLARVLNPVIPQSTLSTIFGYLLTHLISCISSAILEIPDIPEIESNRLTKLLRLIYPLENVFVGGAGAVDHVSGWLKFCYIAEILQANLVDITYLLEQGALIDFTIDELVRLIKALFANSEKRDQIIEKIERDGTGMKAT
ncbi:uncharacterized protein L203_101187 [Cryptococcus depauperatus CBS 7841]|uniref:ZW10 C-terminal helical domain-containing protein n=1 Tax=Cryptococcus depauperatus CBS 7841 TaxID=1295531 RepID=A0AAJ8JPL5_9TREE